MRRESEEYQATNRGVQTRNFRFETLVLDVFLDLFSLFFSLLLSLESVRFDRFENRSELFLRVVENVLSFLGKRGIRSNFLLDVLSSFS
jgi:hypothetical protein